MLVDKVVFHFPPWMGQIVEQQLEADDHHKRTFGAYFRRSQR
jgi:hypothetical protein